MPAAFFENQKVRKSLIQVTLEANQSVAGEWPFASVTGVTDGENIDQLMQKPTDTRERLAALITAPQNVRFSRVIVNRIWKQLIGAGLVEPVHDWEGNAASHPELLDWLAQELITNNYDFRHVVRLIVTSTAYQRGRREESHRFGPDAVLQRTRPSSANRRADRRFAAPRHGPADRRGRADVCA